MAQRAACAWLFLLPAVFGQLKFNPESLQKDTPIAGGSRLREATEAEKPALIWEATGPPICPITDGVYEDIDYCDAYWTCTNEKPVQTFCEDGLVFDPAKALHSDPCDSPHVVPCGDRQLLQEATFPSEFCPRKYGTFEHPDPKICNIYYQCVNGIHTETTCTVGLHFNGTQGNCNWPHISQRTGCVDKAKEIKSTTGVFTCPTEPRFDSNGQKIPHPSYPNLDDCAKFYVCLSGVTPQEASCDKGLVFNDVTMLCDLPDQVPECVGWYADDPEFAHYYEDVPASGRSADVGAVDASG